jgi:predicted GNAT superfamily acetyltransferase
MLIRECTSLDEFDACVELQRKVFALPELEVSPRRHLVVSTRAGGWILGAFADELVGFVHHLVAVRKGEIIGYSHMMAVATEYQNVGLGAKLKWAQRERALKDDVKFITWTWDPMMARNAHFNLNRLGVITRSYAVNFYGTDYPSRKDQAHKQVGIDSDRLFAEWELTSTRVEDLSRGEAQHIGTVPVKTISIPPDWQTIVRTDRNRARYEQLRVREEFQQAFADNLICKGFNRNPEKPQYLLYQS